MRRTIAKDFKDALVGCYNALRSQYGVFWQWDLASDDVRHQWNTLDIRRNLDEYTYQNNEGFFSSRWNGYYSLIYRANYILQAIENIDEGIVPKKQEYIGEAKFMRAIGHFDLVRAFGDIPLITKVMLDDEAIQTGRTSVNAVYEQIISDLKDAGYTDEQIYNLTEEILENDSKQLATDLEKQYARTIQSVKDTQVAISDKEDAEAEKGAKKYVEELVKKHGRIK